MKVVIVSDTHGNLGVLRNIANKEINADAFIHVGDSCLTSEEIRPFISVRGNCDSGFYPLTRILYFEGWRCFVTHGEGLSKSDIVRLAKNHKCSVAIYGHTHRYDDSITDTIYTLNPGSADRPRDGYVCTYMVVDFSEDDIKITKKEAD